jgi:hypothetical protein
MFSITEDLSNSHSIQKTFRYKGSHLRNCWSHHVNKEHLRNEIRKVHWLGVHKYLGHLQYPIHKHKVIRQIKG